MSESNLHEADIIEYGFLFIRLYVCLDRQHFDHIQPPTESEIYVHM